MKREKDLAKNTLIISIGNICTKLITFLLLPLYTAVLSTKEYGIVDLLNTLVSLLLPIITFQIENAVFRELVDSRKNEKVTGEIISNSISFVMLQIVIYVVLFLIVSPFVKNNYKYFLCTNVLAYVVASLFLQIARGLGDNKKYAIGSFISAVSTVVLNVVLLVRFNYRVEGMLSATLIGQILCGIYLLFTLKLYKYIRIKRIDKNIIKKLLKYSIPLIPNAISWWIFNSSDRVIVSWILGVSYTGILAASYKFSSAYILVYNIFHLGWTESISLHINDEDIAEYFNKMFNTLLRFFASIGILAICVMPFAWPLMVNQRFSDGYGLVIFLMLSVIFQTVVGMTSVIYLGKKKTRAVANTSIITAIVNIVSHLLLIKFVGLYAAAISTLLAFASMAVYRVFDVSKKYFRIKLDFKFVLISILFVAILFPIYYSNNIYINIVGVFLGIIYFFYYNKKSFKQLIKLARKRS